MVCRESLLRYTLVYGAITLFKLWFAGNRC